MPFSPKYLSIIDQHCCFPDRDHDLPHDEGQGIDGGKIEKLIMGSGLGCDVAATPVAWSHLVVVKDILVKVSQPV